MARVCTLSFQCIELTQARRYRHHHLGGGKTTIQKTNNPPWTFASSCGAAAGLCSTTQYAGRDRRR